MTKTWSEFLCIVLKVAAECWRKGRLEKTISATCLSLAAPACFGKRSCLAGNCSFATGFPKRCPGYTYSAEATIDEAKISYVVCCRTSRIYDCACTYVTMQIQTQIGRRETDQMKPTFHPSFFFRDEYPWPREPATKFIARNCDAKRGETDKQRAREIVRPPSAIRPPYALPSILSRLRGNAIGQATCERVRVGWNKRNDKKNMHQPWHDGLSLPF